MKRERFLLLILVALVTLRANAAKVTYTPSGILSFSETTVWGDDIAITFRKCMANELFTFYEVSVNDKCLNSARYSDNIGPFSVSGNWIGGNHTKGEYKTAGTLSYAIKLDGVKFDGAFESLGNVLTIEVENELIYTDGSPFAREYVTYIISGNSIEVNCRHEYSHTDTLKINCYYGMQSMFNNEREILLPGTKISSWIPITNTEPGHEIYVAKINAPRFCTFVEHGDDGYQASYLMPEDLGNHSWVPQNDVVFIGNSSGKSYHKIIGSRDIKSGESSIWKGRYTWFSTPLTDQCRNKEDDGNFQYGTYVEGEPVIIDIDKEGIITQHHHEFNAVIAYPKHWIETAGNEITLHTEATCFDLSGKVVYHGKGTFRCEPGFYILRNREGIIKKIKVI